MALDRSALLESPTQRINQRNEQRPRTLLTTAKYLALRFTDSSPARSTRPCWSSVVGWIRRCSRS